jgi:hypothetical protein
LVVLLRFQLHEPLVVIAADVAGLALWPQVQGGA